MWRELLKPLPMEGYPGPGTEIHSHLGFLLVLFPLPGMHPLDSHVTGSFCLDLR